MKKELQFTSERVVSEKFNTILWLIAGVALLLRVWGMWFGLPLLLHPDEPVFVNPGMRFGTGDLNPHWFGHPGNILMYLLFFEFLGYYFIGYLFGWFQSPQTFSDHFFSDPTVFYLMGRSIGVLSGTLSVVAIGYLGKRLVNERVGIGAALFLSVSSLCVQHSKYIRTDILGTLFIILAVISALKFYDNGRRKDAIMSSIAVGLATATKYPFAVIGIVVLLLAIFQWRERSSHIQPESVWSKLPWKFLLVNCMVILISFFCTTPYFFLDLQTALKNIFYEAGGNKIPLRAESLPLFQNFWWYLSDVLPRSEGVLMIVGAVLGLLLNLRRFNHRKLLVMAFPVLFFIVIGSANLRHRHWIIPIIPFVGLYAAVAVDFLSSQLISFKKLKEHENLGAIRLATLLLFFLILVVCPVKYSISGNRAITLPDTRQLCTEWIKKHIPEGKFAQEFYTFQPNARYAYSTGEFQYEEYKIYQDFSIAGKNLDEYRAEGFTHLIVSNSTRDRYLREPARYPREAEFYGSLLSMAPLKTFEPVENRVKGPGITTYAIQ